ncbi:MAG TPA: TfuA domain-containing protein, partial [Sinorhizobium sp.]|nr:TfuA domain-containing protein [Sinorhizobium sp.]
HVPSVWHKEILWAMANGIHVFGAASMGALRAAELHLFGMVGVGRIFDAYCSGALAPYGDPFEDDDEVAVIHGPPETGYVALSEAMVNIRATLAAAATAGIISAATREALVRVGKAMFYQERSYEALLEQAPATIPPQEIAALGDWLPEGRVNLKRQDALDMLAAMRSFLEADPAPKQVAYSFAHTTLWDNAVAACEDEQAVPEDFAADELRIGSAASEAERRTGLWRMLALQECERRGIDGTAEERRQATAQFRRRHGLATAAELEHWLTANHLDRDGFNRLMADEVRLDQLAAALGWAVTSFGLDELRVRGHYTRLAERAGDKERSLDAIPAAASMPDEAALLQAMVWYFEDRLGREIPTDIEAYARATGYADAPSFRRAVWREHLYSRLAEARRARRGAAG